MAILAVAMPGIWAQPDYPALADTREAHAGMASSFQLAAVMVSLIVLGSAFRNKFRRRKVTQD